MKKGLVAFLCFTLGGGAGFAAGWYFTKKKYLLLADQEAEDVKNKLTQYYNDKYGIKEPKKAKEEKKVESVISGTSIIPNQTDEKQYYDYSRPYRTPAVEQSMKAKEEVANDHIKRAGIYLMDEEEFSKSTLPTRTVYLYADDIVADENGKMIENAVDMLSEEGLQEARDVSYAYVHNEGLDCDFEIIWQDRTYSSLSASDKGF